MGKSKRTIHLVTQVLKAREWSEETAKDVLREANAVLDRDALARDAAARRVEDSLAALRDAHASSSAVLNLDRIHRLRQWHGNTESARDAAQAEVDHATQQVQTARDGLGELVAERRALETLQDRLMRRAAGEQALSQARLVDESYAASLARVQEDDHGTR